MIERQELQCHNCMMFVQFDLDLEMNGNHVLNCPNCNHEHCRVIKNGKITHARWDSRNGILKNNTWQNISTTCTCTSTSTMTDYLSNYTMTTSYSGTSTTSDDSLVASGFMYQSWFNTQVKI